MGREVVGVDPDLVAGALVRRRVDDAAEEQFTHAAATYPHPTHTRSSVSTYARATVFVLTLRSLSGPGKSVYGSGVLMRRLTAGMVGFVGLTLEIAYTRIVSFKLFYYYTYFVIGLALLGLRRGRPVTALSARLRNRDVLDTVRVMAPIVGLGRCRRRTSWSPSCRPTST